MKLSIIIPVYNVEKYIERCIRSVANQDLSKNEYEIIIVNDGSTDSSIDIINKVSKEYSNIIIHNQENTGLGGARNKGITLAKGTYVWFIDSDDFIETNSIKDLVSKSLLNDVDVLSFDFGCTNEKGESIKWIDFCLDFKEQPYLTGDTFYLANYKHSYIWLYLFKRSLFIDNDIRFEERINMQDSEIMPRVMIHVKKIMHESKIIYYYVNRENSFINNKNKEVRIRYYYSIIKVAHLLNVFKNTLPKSSLIYIGINNKLSDINRILFLQFIYNDFDDSILKQLIIKLKENNLHPFRPIKDEKVHKSILYNIIRFFINKFPINARKLYLNINR
ncbi:glycosyltransferase [Flavivirga aquimarina]|uniref:Glycosyltransferase n=1 Tax=Flavivirga aquimarina TaxID=2027862 RepID=A0ABT8WDL8_9FLAO|nr:glycosyltransferase [Flavivirga aquimarina]MDO5971126.1 glycosyltransferase [Flavivirga aquimarina]